MMVSRFLRHRSFKGRGDDPSKWITANEIKIETNLGIRSTRALAYSVHEIIIKLVDRKGRFLIALDNVLGSWAESFKIMQDVWLQMHVKKVIVANLKIFLKF